MRVLFTNQPGLGHWHPLVPFARALQAAGHEVAFAVAPILCSTVQAKAFRCFPVGTEETEQDVQEIRMRIATFPPEERAASMWVNVFGGIRAERTLHDVLSVINEWHPDILIRDMTEFGGWVAAERAGIPHVAVHLVAFRQHLHPLIMPRLNLLRESVGLSPIAGPDAFFRYLVLSPRPPSFQDPAIPLPPTTHAIRYTGFNQSGDETLPSWIGDLPDRPTVYATLGTVINNRTDVFSAILDGLHDEPLNLIVTVGRDRDPLEFGPQPDHIHIERYIAQSLLLPHCDLVITHGGSGTIMDTLSFGLPLVVIPLAADQPPNARRCAELGVGRVIQPDEVTPRSIRDATREVLHNPSYRQNAMRLKAEIEALPGMEYAVALLERLAVEKEPIINNVQNQDRSQGDLNYGT